MARYARNLPPCLASIPDSRDCFTFDPESGIEVTTAVAPFVLQMLRYPAVWRIREHFTELRIDAAWDDYATRVALAEIRKTNQERYLASNT